MPNERDPRFIPSLSLLKRLPLIDGARVAVQLEFATAGKVGGDIERKLGDHRKAGGGDVDMIVGGSLRRASRTNDHLAVLELKLLDREVGGRTR